MHDARRICALGTWLLLGCADGGGTVPIGYDADAGPAPPPGTPADAGAIPVLPDGGPPLGPGSLEVVSGAHQLALESLRSLAPVVVRALDGRGRPRAGVPVHFESVEGVVTFYSAADVVTDGGGLAAVEIAIGDVPDDRSFATQRIKAVRGDGEGEVEIELVAAAYDSARLPPVALLIEPAGRDLGRATTGSELTGAVQVQVTAQSGPEAGQPVPGLSVRLVPTDEGAPEAATCADAPLTDADGFGRCDVAVTGGPGEHRVSIVIGESIRFDAVRLGVDP